jgi:hypothetical protein
VNQRLARIASAISRACLIAAMLAGAVFLMGLFFGAFVFLFNPWVLGFLVVIAVAVRLGWSLMRRYDEAASNVTPLIAREWAWSVAFNLSLVLVYAVAHVEWQRYYYNGNPHEFWSTAVELWFLYIPLLAQVILGLVGIALKIQPKWIDAQ